MISTDSPLQFVINVAAFIVAIGVLVAVHEFGHFWVARKLGIRVLRFSIGFGKPLYRRVIGKDPVEFVVAAVPLGGYVKLLDEREGNVAERRPIRMGATSVSAVEIQDGVKEGDKVVVAGADAFENAERVSINQ